MRSDRRLNASRRIALLSSAFALLSVVAGCGRVELKTAAPATAKRVDAATASGVGYPGTPQTVFHAARKAAIEGDYPLYHSYVTKEAIEKTAAGYLYAAATGQPPLGVTAGPDFRERIAVIRSVLKKQGVAATDVESAYYDPAVQTRVLGHFASPSAFVAEVMERLDPDGDKDLLSIKAEHWSVQAETAEVICDVPGGDFRTVPFRKVDGRWKIDR